MSDGVPKPTSWSERFEALRFISKTQRALREQRRGSQLRAFFTTVTFYGLIDAAKFTGKLTLPQAHHTVFTILLWVLLLGIALLSSIYLEGLHTSNSVNRELAHNAEREIMNAVGLSGPTKAGRTIAKTRLWEIAVIFLFALATGAAVTWF